jgi:hypothetical protein
VQSDRRRGGCQVDAVVGPLWAGRRLLGELSGPLGVCAVVQAEEGAELFAVAARRAGHRTAMRRVWNRNRVQVLCEIGPGPI